MDIHELATVKEGASSVEEVASVPPLASRAIDVDGMQPHQQEEHTKNYEQLFLRQLELIERLEGTLATERAMAEELRSLDRLKQDFLSNVSHELRTPITTIHGYLSLLEQEMLGSLAPDQLDAVRIALRNLDRLNRLINDLLDFSSITRGQFLLEGNPVDIIGVCTTALKHAELSAQRKDITLHGTLPKQCTLVLGDLEKLLQTVDHLLENAIKFSGHGQSVTLSVSRKNNHVLVQVRDNGIGMTAEQLEHVFAPFVQGESGLCRRYGGLGMGLSLIKHLVALHGGDITLNSAPTKGTTVTLRLPLLKGGTIAGCKGQRAE